MAGRDQVPQQQRVDGPQQVGPQPLGGVGAQHPVGHQRDGGERRRVDQLEPEHDPGHRGSGGRIQPPRTSDAAVMTRIATVIIAAAAALRPRAPLIVPAALTLYLIRLRQ